jgi:hypothetical protein
MIVSVLDLWLPIVLAAVAVFVLAFLAWAVLPHHNSEIARLTDEDALLNDIRSKDISPGVYMFPWYGPKDRGDPVKKKRHEAGPNGLLILWPGPPNMGANLLKSLIFYLVAAICVAYLARLALSAGAEFRPVFRFTCAAAFLVYCLGLIPNMIWIGKTLKATTKSFIDGMAYAAATGLIFAWLWPAAESAMPAMPAVGG